MNQKNKDGNILEFIIDEQINNEADILVDNDFLSKMSQRDKLYQYIAGAVIGRLIEFNKSGQPRVDYPQNPNKSPVVAKTTISLGIDDIGNEVVLFFEYSKPDKPIVMGIIKGEVESLNEKKEKFVMDVMVDGKKIVLNAERDIVLKCGDASITLTRAGKIIIRGSYLVSRSSGVNKIKGGSVQIN